MSFLLRRLLVWPMVVVLGAMLLPTPEEPVLEDPRSMLVGSTAIKPSAVDYTWRRYRHDAAYGGSVWTERTRGARAVLRFRGSSLTWFTLVGPRQGRARVFIDGTLVRRVNNYRDETRRRARRFRDLGPGRHRLRIVVAGKRGAPEGGRWVGVDAFRVDGSFVPESRARYRWARRRVAGAHNGDVRVSRARGATATASFHGKGIDWTGVRGPRYGRAALRIDGKLDRVVDTSAAAVDTGIIASIAGLRDEGHTIRIRVRRGGLVALDRFIVRRPSIRVFRGLGAWVDLWDGVLDPAVAAADMAERGVDTLYLQTARYNSDGRFGDKAEMDEWLREAHAVGIKVVGWYLPAYDEHLRKDVRRTAAIASYTSPDGERFDALAVDIEYKGETESLAEFNRGIRKHLRRVRARVGNRYPIGGITPAPVGMALSPSSWEGFPWKAVGRYADVVQPMAYWSYRTDEQCAASDLYCASGYTTENIRRARAKTGLRVHIIGGVGDSVSRAEVADFVEAALDTSAIGGSLYDYRTTRARFWDSLAGFTAL